MPHGFCLIFVLQSYVDKNNGDDTSDLDAASSPKRKRKIDAPSQKRAKKDKNAPKKGRSAYNFFIEEVTVVRSPYCHDMH